MSFQMCNLSMYNVSYVCDIHITSVLTRFVCYMYLCNMLHNMTEKITQIYK